MNARYGGFPQGTLVDWKTRGPSMGWDALASFADKRVGFVSPQNDVEPVSRHLEGT